jgi:hypothetical protein
VRWVRRRIQRGLVPGIEPLPSRPTLRERTLALFGECRSVAELTARLKAEEIQTRDRRPLTYSTVLATVRRLKLRSAVLVQNERAAALLSQWASTTCPALMAERLTALGLQTARGSAWTATNVIQKLRQLGIPLPSSPQRRGADPLRDEGRDRPRRRSTRQAQPDRERS